jgi:hypothetical protein
MGTGGTEHWRGAGGAPRMADRARQTAAPDRASTGLLRRLAGRSESVEFIVWRDAAREAETRGTWHPTFTGVFPAPDDRLHHAGPAAALGFPAHRLDPVDAGGHVDGEKVDRHAVRYRSPSRRAPRAFGEFS